MSRDMCVPSEMTDENLSDHPPVSRHGTLAHSRSTPSVLPTYPSSNVYTIDKNEAIVASSDNLSYPSV